MLAHTFYPSCTYPHTDTRTKHCIDKVCVLAACEHRYTISESTLGFTLAFDPVSAIAAWFVPFCLVCFPKCTWNIVFLTSPPGSNTGFEIWNSWWHFIFFFFLLRHLFYVCVVYMYIHVRAWCLWSPEVVCSLGTGITDGSGPPLGSENRAQVLLWNR